MSTPSVYVSYSWGAEDQTPLVDKLEAACGKRGIDLKRDKKQIGYGRSIRAYMDELAAGRYIVLVLSDAYFRSRFCMYELLEIARHGDFHARVLPIVLRGTYLSEPEDWVPYLEYWQDRKQKLIAKLERIGREYTGHLNQAVDDYADFRRLILEPLVILADMNSLTQDIHVETDFEALLGRLIPPAADELPVSRPKRNRMPDSRFRSRIREEIRGVLAMNQTLNGALLAEAGTLGVSRQGDIAEALCACELDKALEDRLRPASISALRHLDANSPEFAKTWEAAKTVLYWLSMLAVSDERIEELEAREAQGGDFTFEIVVNTPFGVEIVSSRFRQIAPDLRLAPGKADVYGGQVIEPPSPDPSWNDDQALDQLVLAIWTSVFPEDSRPRLSESDIKKLNSALKYREKHKTHHHYIPVSMDQPDAHRRHALYKRLMEKIPAMTVIYFKSSGGAPALRIAEEEDFMMIIQQFLGIPGQLGKRT